MAAGSPKALLRVIGNEVLELSPSAFAVLRSASRSVVLDLGTGDGKRARRLAAAHPDWLVLGVDANIGPRLRETSRKAGRAPEKGGTPNVVFIRSDAALLPQALRPIDQVEAIMPWGSLLSGLVRPNPALLGSVARVCRPGARFQVVVNLLPWHPLVPEVAGLPEPVPDRVTGELADSMRQSGWFIEGASIIDRRELDAMGASWARRLGARRPDLVAVSFWGAIDPPS